MPKFIGLATEKRGKHVLIVSLNLGFECLENEETLGNVTLGDFCEVEVVKGKAIAFKKVESVAKVEIKGDTISILDICGTIDDDFGSFYKTELFGKVAVCDEIEGNSTRTCQIRIFQLHPDKRVGFYTSTVWGGVKMAENDEITGIVVKIAEKRAEIATSIPETKVSVDNSKNVLKLGDWIRFRAGNRENLPRSLVIHEFDKIGSPDGYETEIIGGIVPTVQVRISQLSSSQKDEILGLIADPRKQISESKKIAIVRYGKWACFVKKVKTFWFVHSVCEDSPTNLLKTSKEAPGGSNQQDTLNSEPETLLKTSKGVPEGSDRQNTLNSEPETLLKTSKEVPEGSNQQNTLISEPENLLKTSQKDERVPEDLDQQNTLNSELENLPSSNSDEMTSSEDSSFSSEDESPEIIENLRREKRDADRLFDKYESVKKRALVTYYSDKKHQASLWLTDDHLSAVYHTLIPLKPGFQFVGSFIFRKNRWKCLSNDQVLTSLIAFSSYAPLTAFITVFDTYHSMFGQIDDPKSLLPEKCSAGVKIGIQKNKKCWFVRKVFRTDHIDLFKMFQTAWNRPKIRNYIKLTCRSDFHTLSSFFDLNLEIFEERPVKMPETNSKFGFTTICRKNLVRMAVFPRIEHQTMRDVMKNVTDPKILSQVTEIRPFQLYQIETDKLGEVSQIMECDQFWTANQNGIVKFRFSSTSTDRINMRTALVKPENVPEFVGKVKFCLNHEIPEQNSTWTADFRILENSEDEDILGEHRVCFSAILGTVRPVENDSNYQLGKPENCRFSSVVNQLKRNEINSLYKSVRFVLRKQTMLDFLKKEQIDVEMLMEAVSSSAEALKWRY